MEQHRRTLQIYKCKTNTKIMKQKNFFVVKKTTETNANNDSIGIGARVLQYAKRI